MLSSFSRVQSAAGRFATIGVSLILRNAESEQTKRKLRETGYALLHGASRATMYFAKFDTKMTKLGCAPLPFDSCSFSIQQIN